LWTSKYLPHRQTLTLEARAAETSSGIAISVNGMSSQ